jgi:hypothetical protein
MDEPTVAAIVLVPFRLAARIGKAAVSAAVGLVGGIVVWFAAWSVMVIGTLTIGSIFIGWDRATQFAPKIVGLLVPGCYIAAPIGILWGLWQMASAKRDGRLA